MKIIIIILMLIQIIYGGAFLVNFGENSSSFFKESVFKAVKILDYYIALKNDVNIL